ncbi:MAG: DUF1573 domain-containing protein [Bacteroidota bacterium]
MRIQNMRTLGAIVVICALTAQLSAQPISRVKYEVMLATADERMEARDYYNALTWYRDAYQETKAPDLAMSVAYAYYKLRDFKNAERWYERVLDKDVDLIFIDDRYAYGRTLRAQGNFDKAQEQFTTVIQNSADAEIIAASKLELQGIEMSPSVTPNENVLVSFASDEINDGTGEYSPVQFDEKTVYFTSFQSRKETILDGSEEDWTSKVYSTTRNGADYGKPEALSRVVNRDSYHVGNVCFSADKKTMYYSRQILRNDEVISSTLYRSDRIGDEWGAAEPVPVLNGDWITTQPAAGELFGDEVLFFVSDKDGGQGGLDIYYATVRGNTFAEPVNLGPIINTSEDDITPHYYDGTLYFSTEGRPGLGGYDLFASTWNGNLFSAPENVGRNYNSLFDDFYLSYNEDGTQGYLVSNRPDPKKKKLKSETCCYDIYNFEIKQLNIDLLVGVGTADEQPLEGATVEVADQTIYDEPQSKTLPDEYRFSFDLNPERKYQIITSKEGYVSDTIEFTTNGITEDQTIRKKVLLTNLSDLPPTGDGTGEPGGGTDPGFITETVTINEPIRLDNIYYDFNKWDILPDAEKDLTVILNLMNEYSDMVIELSSHTDSRGPKPFNQDLSQRRAESARSWLMERGVAADRIIPKGYGEERILNGCTDGVRCKNEEHRFNRRTEFTIVAGPQTIEIRREVRTTPTSGKQSIRGSYNIPIITFDQGMIDIGEIRAGESKEVVYEFQNTGTEDLVIELVTACKCTNLDWPTEPIPPGGRGKIVAIFDSTGMAGPHTKTITIIANTEPIVVEAKFQVEVTTE